MQEYGKLLYQIWKKKNKKSFYSWKMDETYIKIKEKWHYLYRSIDAGGLLDIWLRKKRDTQAAGHDVKTVDVPQATLPTDLKGELTDCFQRIKRIKN